MTPSHLAVLGAEVEPERLLPRRALILAGEASPTAWARDLASRAGCSIFNSYGPTETVVAVTTERVDPEAPAAGTAWPIGRPLPDARVRVLERRCAWSRRASRESSTSAATPWPAATSAVRP